MKILGRRALDQQGQSREASGEHIPRPDKYLDIQRHDQRAHQHQRHALGVAFLVHDQMTPFSFARIVYNVYSVAILCIIPHFALESEPYFEIFSLQRNLGRFLQVSPRQAAFPPSLWHGFGPPRIYMEHIGIGSVLGLEG